IDGIISDIMSTSQRIKIIVILQGSRHPRCINVPYTTLFRSNIHERDRGPVLALANNTLWFWCRSDKSLHGASTPEPQSIVRQSKDRKSTRLNSSHVSISYAVFCLKKKKISIKINISTNRNNM